ncbi:MAG: hypothetical protein P8H05_02790 [Schleiferiaceae bacterium]|nr:hypothetical protein [Schleiferiaceae bacterium]
MKIILGDNQFFGVNHFDLKKGDKTRSKFETVKSIESFINEALESGLHGFMINSNEKGFETIEKGVFDDKKEIHYSVPYPHKYANMVNESGMISLLRHVVKNTSLIRNFIGGFKLALTRDLKSVAYQTLDIEIPKKLKKGSFVYLQNIVTDLLVGLGRGDLLVEFIRSVDKLGYRPGLITLNPIMVDGILTSKMSGERLSDLILCFNINKEGFNVFPSLESVECFIESQKRYKLMGMSIFASGASNIPESVEYIKKLNLDYIVFGSSNVDNIQNNLDLFKKK